MTHLPNDTKFAFRRVVRTQRLLRELGLKDTLEALRELGEARVTISALRGQYEALTAPLHARIAELERSRDGWKEEAETYAKNADHWQGRFTKVQANAAQLREVLEERHPCARLMDLDCKICKVLAATPSESLDATKRAILEEAWERLGKRLSPLHANDRTHPFAVAVLGPYASEVKS